MLRSEFEPGSTRWAVRRAQWRAMGIPEEDFHKPKIAVVNSSSTLSVCYIHLDQVSQVVQQAVREAGGLPFEIRTAAPSDFITSAGKKARYLMPTRDLIVNDIEVMVEGYLTPTGPGDPRTPGILTEGCYNKHIDLATRSELIWGDYYLFEALQVLDGYIKATEV